MRQPPKSSASLLDRVLGLFGGLVCAFVTSLAAFYICGVFRYHILWFIGASAVAVLVFSLLGVSLHRYFTLFFIPVFNFFGNGDYDHKPLKAWLAATALLLALLALAVGALFQVHIVFAVGAGLFGVYAASAPRAFPVKGGAT
jgi:hypothetical protein